MGPSISGLGGAGEAVRRTRTEAGEGLGDLVTEALDALGAAEQRADAAAQQAATGDLESVSEYMMLANEAQLMTELTVAVRNRAIDSFNEIMRMQV